MTAVQIDHEPQRGGGAFLARRGEEQVGELFYTLDGDALDLEHTVVDPEYRGEGLGEKLVRAAVDYARANDKKLRDVLRA